MESMETKEKQYRLLDARLANFHNRISGENDYREKPLIPFKDNFKDAENELKSLEKEVMGLEHSDPVLDVLYNHFCDFIAEQKITLKKKEERPAEYISAYNSIFIIVARCDSRPDYHRVNALTEIYNTGSSVWEGLKTWIGEASDLYLNEFITYCRLFVSSMDMEKEKIDALFPLATDKSRYELKCAIGNLQGQMSIWADYVSHILEERGTGKTAETGYEDKIPFTESYYRSLLDDQFGVKLDELLSWYEEEMEKTRANVFDIASRLDIPDKKPTTMKEVNYILNKYAGPCQSAEEMFKRAEGYLKRTRAVCHEFVKLPDDEVCPIGDVPQSLKFSWPWGGALKGCPYSRPLNSGIFYNSYNYKAITDGWIKMNTIHEAYPGHHVQFVRRTMDPIPKTFKIGAKAVPIIEGTAHRSEKAFQFIFAEDQFFPLFVAYRRHHTAVRIKSDLMLRYFGRPIGEAVKLYMDELDFDEKTAHGQVRQQEEMQGYFTCYYYGVKKLEQWEKEMGFDKKTYTEHLFSVGAVSLESFRKYLLLSEEDKIRLTHNFG